MQIKNDDDVHEAIISRASDKKIQFRKNIYLTIIIKNNNNNDNSIDL